MLAVSLLRPTPPREEKRDHHPLIPAGGFEQKQDGCFRCTGDDLRLLAIDSGKSRDPAHIRIVADSSYVVFP